MHGIQTLCPPGKFPVVDASTSESQGQSLSGGHGHDSDDPLAWLRESVPGESYQPASPIDDILTCSMQR